MKTLTPKIFSILASFSLLIGLAAISHAQRIYVKQDATGLNDGTSWTNAYLPEFQPIFTHYTAE